MPEARDSQQMQATGRPVGPDVVKPATTVASEDNQASAPVDLNEQLRENAREIRALADTYVIEEGRVFLRSTIRK